MVITVQCSSCHTGFPVDPAKIPAGGVKVRCSACGSIFRVESPSAEEASAPEQEGGVGAGGDTLAGGDTDSGSDWFDATDRRASGEPEATGANAAEFASDASAAGEPADWVFEREEDVDPDSLEINPVGTVEETVSGARDESSFFGVGPSLGDDTGSDDGEGDGFAATDTAPSFDLDEEPTVGSDEEAAPPSSAPATHGGSGAGEADTPAAPVSGFTFGQRDPKEKAQRLARVLVSDMIMYNPERHERALANGTLRDDFEEEIAKSWKEYVDQVGEDMAESTDFWTEALNDVLAKGERVF